MGFSICIPNYNYEQYLGRTLQSVLDQTYDDLEIVIADNASTDRSVEIARSFDDPRIRIEVNSCNVGFAGNLDRAGRMATKDVMIMLSSDDLMRPAALSTYRDIFDAVGSDGSIVCATADRIDSDDKVTGRIGPNPELWHENDRMEALETRLKVPVYRVHARELLGRWLLLPKNPFNFLATAYPRKLYNAIEGYGGGRLFNPDKWFHLRLLGVADTAYFIDCSLFAYRWHDSNQMAQEARAEALKYLVDEYVATIQLDIELLSQVQIERDQVVEAFIEHSIARHGLATLARGNRGRAKQIFKFGQAVYPKHVRRNTKARILGSMLSLGPIGKVIAKRLYYDWHRDVGNGSRIDEN